MRNLLFIAFFGITLSIMLSCDNSVTPTNDSNTDKFESTDSGKISSSIISIPESLSTTTTRSTRADATDDSNENTWLFTGVRDYIAMAENIKNGIKNLLVDIVPHLATVELNKEITLDNPSTDGPKKVKIEKPTGADYQWKIGFYYEIADTTPDMIVRLTVEENGAKGQIKWNFKEDDSELKKLNKTVSKNNFIVVKFDGTKTTKTLEIKYSQDLTNVLALTDLTDKDKENIFSQPAKVFVSAQYDGTEYTVTGTSYHPGLEKLNNPILNKNRYIYSFKAKAVTGDNEGAKLYLALPLKTNSDVKTIWSNDDVSTVYSDFMLETVNKYIADITDDANKKIMMGYILNKIPETAAATITDTEWASFKTWAATQTDTKVKNLSSWTNDALNTWYNGLNDTNEPKKKDVYALILRPTLFSEVVTHGYSVTKTELEAFVNKTTTLTEAIEFKNKYKSMKYIINPCFFNKDGVIGTYDSKATKFYKNNNGTFSEGDKPTNFDTLNNLNLDSIDPYTADAVVKETLSVE